VIRAKYGAAWFIAVPANQRVDYYGDDEIDPTDECKGCLFAKERPSVCRAAGEAAIAAGLPDCESRPEQYKPGYIYVSDPSQGRQLDLLASPDAAT
jgi:hypothetical protein